jgi:hypothetical protein
MFDNIEIGKHNVTIWCNDQTCTTMKCDKYGCRNNTCNIYDTDLTGECREYHINFNPEEPSPPELIISVSNPQDHNHITEEPVQEGTQKPESTVVTTKESNKIDSIKLIENLTTMAPLTSKIIDNIDNENKDNNVAARPLELEAVLSSTVTDASEIIDSVNAKPVSRRGKVSKNTTVWFIVLKLEHKN